MPTKNAESFIFSYYAVLLENCAAAELPFVHNIYVSKGVFLLQEAIKANWNAGQEKLNNVMGQKSGSL